MTLEERALPIPDDIVSPDGDVVELARVWWNNGQPAMVIRAAMHEPRVMGGILAELAWHFSRAYADRHGLDKDMALRDIREAWIEAGAYRDTLPEESAQ